MNKAKSRKKVIALSVAAASSVALATYTVTSMAQNNGVKDQTALNLNVDKIDKDTVKISVDNITEAIKSLQLSLEIPSGAKFASEGAIKWLVKDSEGIQKDIRISNGGKYLDILILSNEELDRDGSKLDICEIDVAALDSILGAKSSGYQIVPRKNGNETSYTYVVTNTNKSKSGNNIVNSSDEMLKINTPPTISLKEGTINEAIISKGRIEVIEGYDFDSNFKSFVDAKDTDGDIDDKNITYFVEAKDGTKVENIDTSVVGSYNVKIVVTDDAGETAEVSAIVNVKQEKVTELPTITGVKKEHTIYAGDVFDPMEGISAKDARGNSLEVKLSGDFNLEEAGEYTLTYTVTDKWGNVAEETTILTVIKDEAPVITGVVDKTIEKNEEFDPLEGVEVTDDNDKDIKSKLKVTGQVNNKVAGEYKLSYSVTDSANNTTRAQRTITVLPKIEDGLVINSAPTITGVKDQTIKVGESFDPKAGVSANDKEDGDLTSKIEIDGKVDTDKVGEYKLTYTVEDSKGAKATVSATITVVPKIEDGIVINSAPTITGVKDQTIKVGESFDPKAGVSANDKEDGDLTSKIEIDGKVDTDKVGKYKLTYTVKDSKGAKATASATITVEKSATTEQPNNPSIPPSISDKLDSDIVEIIAGNGEKDNPLNLEIKEVNVKDLNNFLNSLKELKPFVESISRDGEYTVYKIKLENNKQSLFTKLFRLFKITDSDENIYLEVKVKNTYTDLVDALNEFSKETNPSIVIPQNQDNPDSEEDNQDESEEDDDQGNQDLEEDNQEKPQSEQDSDFTGNKGESKPNGPELKPDEDDKGNSPATGDTGILYYLGLGAIASGVLVISLRKKNKK